MCASEYPEESHISYNLPHKQSPLLGRYFIQLKFLVAVDLVCRFMLISKTTYPFFSKKYLILDGVILGNQRSVKNKWNKSDTGW